MKSYYKRLLRMAWRDPRKIPSMVRLKFKKTDEWKKDFTGGATAVSPPFIVSVRLNYACTLRCVMCNQWGEEGIFVKDPGRAVKRDMSTADWKAFFDEIAPFRPYVHFVGGEPMMNPDLIELVRYASSRHMLTSITTNGLFLKEKAGDLVEAGLDYIHTSLDSPVSRSDDAVIRKKTDATDSAAQAADGIRHLVEMRDRIGVGLPIVQVQTVLVKENQDLLLPMAEFVETELKPDVWSLQLCVFTTPELNEATSSVYRHFFRQGQVGWSGFIRDFNGMNYGEIERHVRIIQRRKWSFKLRLYKPMGMKGFSFERYFAQPLRDTSDVKLKCMHPYVFAQVQPDGNLVFCGEQPDYVVGNVKKERFMDLWCGERAAEWRTFLQKRLFPSCKRCYALHELDHFAGN